jgi:hypothetical protein
VGTLVFHGLAPHGSGWRLTMRIRCLIMNRAAGFSAIAAASEAELHLQQLGGFPHRGVIRTTRKTSCS